MKTSNVSKTTKFVAAVLALIMALSTPGSIILIAAPVVPIAKDDVISYYNDPLSNLYKVSNRGIIKKPITIATDDAPLTWNKGAGAGTAANKDDQSTFGSSPVNTDAINQDVKNSDNSVAKTADQPDESIKELREKYLPKSVGGGVEKSPANLDSKNKKTSVEETLLQNDAAVDAISNKFPPKKPVSPDEDSDIAFPAIPIQKKDPDIAGDITGGKENSESSSGQDQNQISITNSRNPRRGINIKAEVPSVRHITMSPASKKFGGDDVEIVISPIYEVLIQMPDAIEFYKTSSTKLVPTTVPTNPQLISLKLLRVVNPTPISLHLVDINQNIYTFTIIGTPSDLSWEYPKTIVVTRRTSEKTPIGVRNPKSIIDAMDVDDAIQIVVGDKPNTSEYEVEFISGRFMHYEGYVQYSFRVFRKEQEQSEIPKAADGAPNLKFTIWANNRRLDSGSMNASSREIEWTIEPTLSKRETRRRGYEVLRVFVQIRASILDLEEWTSAFMTVSDTVGYTRFDFPPLIRDFRAPTRSKENGSDE